MDTSLAQHMIFQKDFHLQTSIFHPFNNRYIFVSKNEMILSIYRPECNLNSFKFVVMLLMSCSIIVIFEISIII